MNQFIKLVVGSLIALLFLASCNKKKDDDKGLLFGAAILASQQQAAASLPAEQVYADGSTITLNAGQTVKLTPPSHVAGSTYKVDVTLPAGLTLDASTGVITGSSTIKTSGKYIVTQTKPDSTTVSITFTIVINGTDTGGTTTTTYTIGGTVTGLTAAGLVLQNNTADDLTVAANATTFSFTTKVTGAYAVTVKTQPTGLTCTVTSGSGTATANVTGVAVACSSGGGGGTTTETVATPTFSPAANTYNSDQSVSISTTTTGATIYYTVDGSNPTTSSTQYSSAISVAGHGTSKTIKAIAIKSGMTNSSVASAAYAITYDTVAIPTFSPAAGTHSSDQSVTISTTTVGATIYYTLDGSEPTTSSTQYSSAISIAGDGTSKTVKAIAVKTGMTNSSVASAAYTITYPVPVATPTFNPTSGTHSNSALNLTISTTTSSANIYFTTDNTNPTTSSKLYGAAIHIWSLAGKTIKAIATKTGLLDSGVATLSGKFSYPPLKTGAGTITGYTLDANEDSSIQNGATRSYTGPTQHSTHTNDYTTTDDATGLVWKTCTQGLSGANCGTGTAAALTWNTADSDATNGCSALNSANSGSGYAGIKTWRAPNRHELETLIDYGKTSAPTINTTAFPGTVSGNYVTTDVYAPFATFVWAYNFSNGLTDIPAKTDTVNVRCVSGLSKTYNDSGFTNNGDGTIKDNVTGLTWNRCNVGQSGNPCNVGTATAYTWANALTACTSPWRLPNVNELKSIVNTIASGAPTINTVMFQNTQSKTWTSTTYALDSTKAWYVTFQNAYVFQDIAKTTSASMYVRCVKGP